ncbi:MAG: hypothetical protein H6737_18030 [Alphaproteobacteria bacterium]|nr:hypothetical protein [Alphaproteobacteria bacterium]
MSTKPLAIVLGVLVAFQAGLLVGQLMPTAAAQETPDEPLPVEPFYDPPRLYCRIFKVPVEGAGSTFETNDRTTEIGKWIEAEEGSYELFTVDFEVGQKPTGFPQGYAQVCLSPRRG